MYVIMDKQIYRFASYNCHSFKNSIGDVRGLCKVSSVVCLQETWLLDHDIPLLGTVSSDFEYTGNSAVDTSTGILRGRPYGGVAILYQKGIFDAISVLQCNSARLAAIKVKTGERSILIFSVYMPVKSADNLPIFTAVLGEISAIEESCNIETVFILGDFNSHPSKVFYNELNNFCLDRKWICADVCKLGMDSGTYTYYDHYHNCRRWLDHCVVSLSAWESISNVGVMDDVYVSDHLPIYIDCNVKSVRPKLLKNTVRINAVIWGGKRRVANK